MHHYIFCNKFYNKFVVTTDLQKNLFIIYYLKIQSYTKTVLICINIYLFLFINKSKSDKTWRRHTLLYKFLSNIFYNFIFLKCFTKPPKNNTLVFIVLEKSTHKFRLHTQNNDVYERMSHH